VSSWKVSSLAARNKCQPRKSARFQTTLLSRSRRSPRESESSFRNEETRFTPLPITLHAALVAVGLSLCTLRITMLSIDSIRLDSQSDAARFYTRPSLPNNRHVLPIIDEEGPIAAIVRRKRPPLWLIRHFANSPSESTSSSSRYDIFMGHAGFVVPNSFQKFLQ